MLINTQVAREVLEHHGHKNKNWNEVSDSEKKECIPMLRERLNLPFKLMPEDEEPFYLWIFVSAIRGNRMIQLRRGASGGGASGGGASGGGASGGGASGGGASGGGSGEG